MPDRLGVSALIAAAGLSRRMGEFKPLLPLGDATVIEKTISAVLSCGVQRAVVVTGYRGSEVAAVIRSSFGGRVRCVENPDYAATDMLRSVQIGAAALPPCDAFFLLPGDMPGVAPTTFGKLLRAREERGRPLLVFPTLEGFRKHPPLVDARLIPHILSYDGEDGLRGLWRYWASDIADVPVEDEGVWFDLDTPEDYKRYLNRRTDQKEV